MSVKQLASSPSENNPPLLIDMDGVLVDMETAIMDWASNSPVLRPYVNSIATRTTHHWCPQAEDPDYQREVDWAVKRMFDSPSFWRALDCYPNAVRCVAELTQRMAAQGRRVFIVTAPHLSCPESLVSKVSVAKRFESRGGPPVNNLVLTRDKTIIRGTALIDDAVPVYGDTYKATSWFHIVFDQPYNRTADKSLLRVSGWSSSTVESIDLFLRSVY